MAETYRQFTHLGSVLPAIAYGTTMVDDLAAAIRNVPADLVLVGTPIDLGRLIRIDQPTQRVRYGYANCGSARIWMICCARG